MHFLATIPTGNHEITMHEKLIHRSRPPSVVSDSDSSSSMDMENFKQHEASEELCAAIRNRSVNLLIFSNRTNNVLHPTVE